MDFPSVRKIAFFFFLLLLSPPSHPLLLSRPGDGKLLCAGSELRKAGQVFGYREQVLQLHAFGLGSPPASILAVAAQRVWMARWGRRDWFYLGKAGGRSSPPGNKSLEEAGVTSRGL